MNLVIPFAAMAVVGALAAGAPALAATAIGVMPMGAMNMGASMEIMPSVYAGEADKTGAPVFRGLGPHHHPISTKNGTTQAFFDQGVNLLFGFDHAEAIRSFREAARRDPDCAICWWGVAVALGPNINLPMPGDAVAPAWQALGRARALEARRRPRSARGSRRSPCATAPTRRSIEGPWTEPTLRPCQSSGATIRTIWMPACSMPRR